ncbi:AmmeMemoRadiSam system protein A [Vibrio hannami]|uniref:AmmeMemoRadiSam system protein A n=1 Tax=Vibrio hannami TaxID=2717094 RepID=UPI00240FE215|nr:AmmeMemoRadiSam system protein A [Vibrio hannami]MDG3087893.1 AmmeMemoRadiSam system protein A [Vibrio hannami]
MSVTLLPHLNNKELNILLDIARTAIQEYIANKEASRPAPTELPDKLREPAGCFVTLEVNGELQGCLGSIYPSSYHSLAEEVARKARSSCFEDTRFPPLESQQLNALTIEVSVLSIPKQQHFSSQAELEYFLANNKCGLIFSEKYRRSVFLPQVWDKLPNPKEFIRHLKLKGGWKSDYWSEELKVETFVVSSVEGKYR